MQLKYCPKSEGCTFTARRGSCGWQNKVDTSGDYWTKQDEFRQTCDLIIASAVATLKESREGAPVRVWSNGPVITANRNKFRRVHDPNDYEREYKITVAFPLHIVYGCAGKGSENSLVVQELIIADGVLQGKAKELLGDKLPNYEMDALKSVRGMASSSESREGLEDKVRNLRERLDELFPK